MIAIFGVRPVVLGYREPLIFTSVIILLCFSLGIHGALAHAEDNPPEDGSALNSDLPADMSASALEVSARTALT